MNARVGPPRRVLAAALLAVLPWLHGCAELMVVSAATAMVKGLPSNEARWVETNRLTVGYPAPDVYALLEQGVERNGRQIVERDAAAWSLRVSYPFSLLKNRWGGTLRVRCVPADAGSIVTIEGDSRDGVPPVRAIGNEVLGDLDAALRRLPRSL